MNGIVINRHQVADLRPLLIDLTAQGQTHQLNSAVNQLKWIDCLGSEELNCALKNVKHTWNIWNESCLILKKALEDREKSKSEYDDLNNLLEDLELAELNDPEEDNKLQCEENRLVNSYKLQEGILKVLSQLREGSENVPSVVEHLAACIQQLKVTSKLDSTLSVYLDKTFDLQVNLDEIIGGLEQYSSLFENESSQLDQVQQRLAILNKLQRKYNLDLPHLLDKRNDLRSLQTLDETENFINKLSVKEKIAREQRDKCNTDLTKIRQKASRQFEEKLMTYLRPLGLSNVRFQVLFHTCQASDNGADAVQFLFSANPGEPLAPLVDVASGGEMSRFLLALKTVLAEVDGSSTLVFDEIDVGVSGRVSGAIARVLKELSRTRQVFCITHQPLLASEAEHHFRVFKSVENGITHSNVRYLSNIQDRENELADLAGGDFAEAKVYVASLLDQKAA